MSDKNLTTFLTEWGGQVKELIEPSPQIQVAPTLDLFIDIDTDYDSNRHQVNRNNLSSGDLGQLDGQGTPGCDYTINYTVNGGNGNVTVTAEDTVNADGLIGSSVLASSDSISYHFAYTAGAGDLYITIQSAESNAYDAGDWRFSLYYYD